LIGILVIIICAIIVALELHESYSIIATIALLLLCALLLFRIYFIISLQKALHIFVRTGGSVRTGALKNPLLGKIFGANTGVQQPIQWLIFWVLETTLILAVVTYDIAADLQLYNPFDTMPTLAQTIMFYVDVVLKGILADFMEVYNLYLPGAARYDAIENPIFGFFIFAIRLFVSATVLSIIIILLRGNEDEEIIDAVNQASENEVRSLQQDKPLSITKE